MTGLTELPASIPVRSPNLPNTGKLSQAQTDFAKLFGTYLVDGVKQKLFAQIDRQGAAELNDCIAVYFSLTILPILRDRSRAVFARLVERIASKGTEAGLVVGVFTKSSGLWREYYQGLESADRGRIDKTVAKQKAALPGAQREFLEEYMKYMSDPKLSMAKLTKLVVPMKALDLQASVRLYLVLSRAYEDQISKRSRDVFFVVSYYALTGGRSTYALDFEKRISDTVSLLHERFVALDPPQQVELRKKIKQAIDADTPPPGSRPGETKLPPLNNDQAVFVKLYRAYVDGRSPQQLDVFQKALVKPSGDELAGLVAIFLEDSERRYGGTPSNESSRIFFGTLSMAIHKSSSFYAVKVKSYIDSKDSLWSRRFDALNVLQYGNRLRSQIEEKIKSARMLDEVKVAFWLKYKRDATLADLRVFDPVEVRPIAKPIDDALSDLDVASKAGALDSLNKAFTTVATALEAQTNPLARWVLVKRILERNMLNVRFRHLAYLQGVGLLYMGCVKTYKAIYSNGFDPEEMKLLFGIDHENNRYFLDFAAQIDATIGTRRGREPKLRDPARPDRVPEGKNDDAYTLLAKAEGALLVCADKMSLTLTPPLMAAKLRGGVEEAWTKQSAKVEAIRFPIDGRRAGKTELKVNQNIGNVYILWLDGRSRTAYLQVKGYEQVVFEADPDRLGKIYEDYNIWGKVAENTAALGYVIPLLFEIIGYIPDLISGGLVGLAKSVLMNLAFEHSLSALGIDPTKAQLVLFGMSLLHAGIQPKASEPHLRSAPEPVLAKEGAAAVKGGSKPVEFYGLDAGTVHVPEAPQLQFYGIELRNQRSTRAPIDSGPGQPSNQRYDPRGLLTADGRNAIGLHEGTVSGGHATGSSPLVSQRNTGPTSTAIENPKTALYPDDMNRAAGPRQVPQQQQMQQQQSRQNRPREDPVGRSTADLKAADEFAKKADRLENIKLTANEQRVAKARTRTGDEVYLTGRPIMSDTGPKQMSILGNNQDFLASRRNGYQVYMYRNAEGQVVYVGLSGRTLEHGTGVTPLSDWETRLMQDHVNSLWIQNAKTVEVVSNLTYQQMNLLEEQLIKQNFGKPYNFNQIANPEAAHIVREGIPDMVIPTNARTHRFGVVITGR